MKIFVTTDTHFGHTALAEQMQSRPQDFQDRILKQWKASITDEDLVIHLGDVVVGKSENWALLPALPGRKVLVIGNHDQKGIQWYLKQSFDFCCTSFTWNMYGWEILFSHMPVATGSFDLNIHGHLHLPGRHDECLVDDRHHLLSLEATNYQPRSLRTLVKEWRKACSPKEG